MNEKDKFSIAEYFTWFLSRLLSNNAYDGGHFFDKNLLSTLFRFLCKKVNTNEFFVFVYKEGKILHSHFSSKEAIWGSTIGVYKNFLGHYRDQDLFNKYEKRFLCFKGSEIRSEFIAQNPNILNSVFDFERLKCIDVMSVYYSDFEIYFGFAFFHKKKDIFINKQDVLIEIFITLSYFFVFSEEKMERVELLKILAEDIKELKNFSSILAHEIKRPLGNIRTRLDIFKQEVKEDEIPANVKDYLCFLEKKLEYLNSLINSMLNYSSCYFSEHQVIEEINLNHLLEDILLGFDVANKNIQVRYSNLPTMWIDRTSIRQIFENIIENAIKNIDKKKEEHIITIEFNFDYQNSKYKFSIRDNGIGIKKANLGKVFELFQKSDDEAEGMGIGLAIVKKILDLHSGKLSVESEFGVGTTFFFELP